MLLVRNENLNWNIPLSSDNIISIEDLIKHLIDIDNINPIMFFSYGIKCKWNKNHSFENLDLNTVKNYFKFYNECINYYGNFSEYNLTVEDLNDTKSNFLLDFTIKNNGFVEISSDKLYKYIKSKYPNAKIVASVEKSFYELENGKEVDFYNNLLDKYDRVVISPNFVKKDSFFDDVEKIKDVSRLEIIVNDQKTKYNYLNKEKETIKQPLNFKDLYENSLCLSNEEIDNIFNKTGIKNFRIIGDSLKQHEYLFIIANYVLKKFGNTPLIFV